MASNNNRPIYEGDFYKPLNTLIPDSLKAKAATQAGMYAKRHVDVKELATNLGVDHRNMPEVIVVYGPNRSGTTPIARAMAHSGMHTYYQYIKGILRNHAELPYGHSDLKKSAHGWRLPTNKGTLGIKETGGPYTPDEVLFDPLAVIQSAITHSILQEKPRSQNAYWEALDIMRKKFKLLFIGRDPVQNFAAWRDIFTQGGMTEDILLYHFIATYRHAETIRQNAERDGIEVNTLLYENYDNHPLVGHLLRSMGIQNPVLENWGKFPSKFHWTDEPEKFSPDGLHKIVTKADRLMAIPHDEANITARERRIMQGGGLERIYDSWKSAQREEISDFLEDTKLAQYRRKERGGIALQAR